MSPPVYVQPPHIYVFFGAIGLWIVSDLHIAWRFGGRGDASQDRGSKRVLGLSVAAGVLGAALVSEFVTTLSLAHPAIAFWGGIGTMVLGVVVRQYAAWTLREYFSLEVTVDSTDSVVTSGPYRWVRHPSYTGGFTTLVGLGVAVGNWVSLAVVIGAGLVGYGYRITVEERALRDRLGEEYEAYAERTPYRLVPGLW